jgi:hypothetical protein
VDSKGVGGVWEGVLKAKREGIREAREERRLEAEDVPSELESRSHRHRRDRWCLSEASR